uniref:Putative secreted protein n=1 Tax=Panstrongylus lignarius TaxID=156445 RepID=A0A224XPF3_9HEMI
MKNFIILFCALVLAQGLKVEDRDQFEQEVEKVLVPLMKEYAELNNLIEEVKQHQQTQGMSSLALTEMLARVPPNCFPTDTPFIEAWDQEGCQKLHTTLKKALDLGETVTDWALKTGLTVVKEIYHIVRCGNVNAVKAMQCVTKKINDIRYTINANKPVALHYKDEVVAMVKELKADFKQCLGVQKKTQAIAEQIVFQAQLCDNMKP